METNTIVELINTVGFPIVACIALFWMNINTLKQERRLLQELQQAVNTNTEVMKELNYQIRRLSCIK